MPPPTSLPIYIYKIIPHPPPTPLPSSLPLSPLDAQDGFIHLSTAIQVPATAQRFYADSEELWVLKIPSETVQEDIRWEEGRLGCFAHLYGRGIGVREVKGMRKFRKGQGGWEGMRDDGWLE